MGFLEKLTKHAVQDPETGQIHFFDSPEQAGEAAAAMQGMADARAQAQTAQPAIATVDNQIPPEGGPVDPGFTQPNSTIAARPPLPKVLQPSYEQASTDAYGMPAQNTPGLTRLGKLIQVLSAAGQGALAGRAASEQAVMASGGRRGGGFGTGFQAAGQDQLRDLAEKRQNQMGALQAQMQQQQMEPVQTPMGTMPFWKLKTILDTQKERYMAGRAGAPMFDVMTGKNVAGTQPDRNTSPEQLLAAATQDAIDRNVDPATDPHVKQIQATIANTKKPGATPEERTFNDLTTQPQPNLGRPMTSDEALSHIAQLKQDVKPDQAIKADAEYQDILKQQALGKALTPDQAATKKAYEARKTLGPRTTFNLQAGGVSDTPLNAKQQATAQAIIDGRMSPPSSFALRTPYWQQVMGAVFQTDPQFSEQRAQLRKDYTVGKHSSEINAINTALGHVGNLSDAVDALNNGNVQVLNRIANTYGVQTGATPVTTFNTIVHRVGPEITKAYVGAGGGEGERGTTAKDFDPALGPAQLKSNIGITAKLLRSKISSLENQWNQNAPEGQQFQSRFIMPAAQQALNKLAPEGGGKAASAAPQGATHTAPGSDGKLHYTNDKGQDLGAVQ